MLLPRFEKVWGNASATFFTKGVELKYNDFQLVSLVCFHPTEQGFL